MLTLPDLSEPLWFFAATGIIFAVVIGRYVLIAAVFFGIFHRSNWQHRKISTRAYKPGQFRKEIMWSSVTALIFALAGAGTALLWQKGYTRLYFDIHDYSIWWLPASLLIALLAHETYYYWLHRWMHVPTVFRIVHKVHHDSNITSPWTAFSFHPLEGLLQAIFLPALLMVLPVHLYVLLIQLTIMTFSSVINHLDIEIYPQKFHRHPIGKWMIGATHHALHHKQFRYNYGLYFTWWDKIRKTESPLFHQLFEEKTKPQQVSATNGEGHT